MSALVLLPGSGKSWQIGGFGVVFNLFGTDTAGRFAIVEHSLAPGTLAAPPHTHQPEDKASYVLEGELTLQIREQIIQAPAGTLGLKPMGLRHTSWNQGPLPARRRDDLEQAGFEHYFRELAALFAAGGPPDAARLGQLTQRRGKQMDLGPWRS